MTLIGLLVVAAGALLLYFSFSHPQSTALAVPSASPSAASGQSSAAAPPSGVSQSLDSRLSSAEAQIRQNAATGRHTAMSFSVTDPELTARVNEALTSGQVQAPVSDVTVNSQPGVVTVTGKAKNTFPFTLTAVPEAVDGKARLKVTSISFGPIPVPGAISQQLSSLVASDNLLGDVPLTVTSFRAESGRVVLEGTT